MFNGPTLPEALKVFKIASDDAIRIKFIKRHLLNVINNPSKSRIESDDFHRCIANEIEYAIKTYDIFLEEMNK